MSEYAEYAIVVGRAICKKVCLLCYKRLVHAWACTRSSAPLMDESAPKSKTTGAVVWPLLG